MRMLSCIFPISLESGWPCWDSLDRSGQIWPEQGLFCWCIYFWFTLVFLWYIFGSSVRIWDKLWESGTVCGELNRSIQLGTLLEKLGFCPVQSSSGQQKGWFADVDDMDDDEASAGQMTHGVTNNHQGHSWSQGCHPPHHQQTYPHPLSRSYTQLDMTRTNANALEENPPLYPEPLPYGIWPSTS